MLYTAILAIHIIVAISMIGLILIQHGKGADAGASFGSGGSSTVFGAAGTANFLTRTTAALTAIFFITSLSLAVFAKKQSHENSMLIPTSNDKASVIQKTTPVNNPVTTTTTPIPATTSPK